MVRPATKDDAPVLARLGDVAGDGLPSYLWSSEAGPNETPLDVGTRRAAREAGDFSYRNAWIYEVDGEAAGILIGRQLDDPYSMPDLSAEPSQVHPLIELEACVPGSWYVNVLAVDAAHRRRGIASALMQKAEQQAKKVGAKTMSLVVASENAAARAVYAKHGYRDSERRSVVPYPGARHGGEWILMIKSIA